MDRPLNPAIPVVGLGVEIHAGDSMGCAAFTLMCTGERISTNHVVRVFLRQVDMRIYDESQLITDPSYWHIAEECPNHE